MSFHRPASGRQALGSQEERAGGPRNQAGKSGELNNNNKQKQRNTRCQKALQVQVKVEPRHPSQGHGS